jgi:glycosyltransferase involved in cell wall biosynthesis
MVADGVTSIVSTPAYHVEEVPEVPQTGAPTSKRSSLGSPRGQGPLRVLLLVENNSVPSDRRAWSVATALVDASCEVVVVCPQGGEDERALFEVRDSVQIRRYPLTSAERGLGDYAREYGAAMWRTWRIVRTLSRERPFDVVHACNPPDFLLFAAWPARRAGARFVLDHHDLTPELLLSRFGEQRRWLHRTAVALERACFAAADVVLATNDSYMQVARTRGRKRAQDVFVVRNGPDLRRFHPLPPDPVLKRGKPLLIGFVGRMALQDGADHALRALALLGERRQDWHAVFAGTGDAVPQLRRLTGELGLEDRVEFVGWLDSVEMSQLLSSCDVCLSPEPQSPLNDVSTMKKIAEYMAMSRPIVAYGLRESRFTAAGAALYAERDDVSSFAGCIDELLDDPERRAEMGRIGRERVERKLSWEHSEQSLLAAYRRALADDLAR